MPKLDDHTAKIMLAKDATLNHQHLRYARARCISMAKRAHHPTTADQTAKTTSRNMEGTKKTNNNFILLAYLQFQ